MGKFNNFTKENTSRIADRISLDKQGVVYKNEPTSFFMWRKKMGEGKDNQEVKELCLRLKQMDDNSGKSKKIILKRC